MPTKNYIKRSTVLAVEAEQSRFAPLASVTNPTVDTATAAYYLNRQPQTLRGWKCHGSHPNELKPLVVNGRLAWPVAGIRKVMGVAL